MKRIRILKKWWVYFSKAPLKIIPSLEDELFEEVKKRLGLKKRMTHLGARMCAAKLVDKHKLMFTWGIAGITAYFYKPHWEFPLDLAIHPHDYGHFLNMSIEEREKLTSIFGGGLTFPIAVFKCMIYAQNAGVLPKLDKSNIWE